MKLLHLGVFDRNIGDNVALLNARKSWEETIGEVEWYQTNLESFWANKNSIKITKEFLGKLKGTVDAVVVGGGGLIEDYHDQETNYKLPFNKEILESCPVPVYFHAVGLNVFRGNTGYREEAKIAIQETIDASAGFSVRNDGSYEKMRDWVGLDVSKVMVIPDPGLLYLERFGIPKKDELKIGGFQPAVNVGQYINNNRFLTSENFAAVKNIGRDKITFPHTVRDVAVFEENRVCSPEEFDRLKKISNFDEYVNNYKKVDYLVALRGHGQLMSIGLNIPGIYLSTQDKVRDFSHNNGFEDFNVDITEFNWEKRLEGKLNLLKQPGSPLTKKWYKLREDKLPEWYDTTNKFIKKCLNIKTV